MAIEKRRQYGNYEEYTAHQLEKTNDPKLRRRWLSKFKGKVEKFKSRFQHLKDKQIISENQKVLCLGARMGEEVVAFNEMGLEGLGVDLAPNLPLVVEGDFNDLKFDDGSYDAMYTNAFDHAWATEQFFDNVYRVLKQNGIFIIDVFPGDKNYARCEVIVIGSADDITSSLVGSGKFEFVEKSSKLPSLQRRHKEVQLIFRKK